MQKCSISKKNGTNNEIYSFINGKEKSLFISMIRILKMLWGLAKFELLVTMGISILGKVLPVIVTMVWKNILQTISESSFFIGNSEIIGKFILYGFIGSIAVGFHYFSEVFDTLFRNVVSIKMQNEVHKKSRKIPVVYFESPQLNDIVKRSQEAFAYGPAVGVSFCIISMISVSIGLVASGILLWSYHYSLVFMIFAIAIPYIFKIKINKMKLDFSIKTSNKRREANVLRSYFTDFKYVKETQVLDSKDFFMNKWESIMKKIKKEELRINIKSIMFELFIEILDSIGYVMVIGFSVYLIMNNKVDIATFGAVIMIIGTLKNNISRLLDTVISMHRELGVVRKGFEYIDLKEEDRKSREETAVDKSVSCENVSYSYPLVNRTVLSDINLDIKKGEVLAIVGANGAGKSTLAKLLLGIYTPDSGEIRYNGNCINEKNYDVLFNNTSAVFQDFNRYYLSIKENIGLSDVSKMEDENSILEAARKSGAIKFIENLPGGIDTNLGKAHGGIELSGGQWQQLALARGYFKDSDFVVLDEPSSALDPIKEATMYKHFGELCRDKIGVIITHRLGAAKLADRIVLMENGSIKEHGTHDELCDKKGLYWEMYSAQADMY